MLLVKILRLPIGLIGHPEDDRLRDDNEELLRRWCEQGYIIASCAYVSSGGHGLGGSLVYTLVRP
jgi:hypothetical protein